MKNELITLGWREKVALPALKVDLLKAKVDTGARTSSLHTFFTELFDVDGKRKVRFGLHPLQGNSDVEIICEADVADERNVTDSGGNTELRPVIKTELIVGDMRQEVEITLTNRDSMKYRMLLGRTTLNGRFVVDPEKSFLTGDPLVGVEQEKVNLSV